ncbi:MAG: NAD(P)-dependent oxidoreductase, partial [Robiginitomaculum sp.]|nr:NAD(P)-dependent oxidoreductase [Robiginitomaculum sp.]
MADLAFLGLGTMGFPMAGHLVIAGHTVTVWNRTTNVAKNWGKAHVGIVAENPSQAVENAQIVF